jgi:diacylglycerol kinase (ATP)
MTRRAPTPRPRAAVVCNPVRVDSTALRAAVDSAAEHAGWAPSVWVETTAQDPGQGAARQALNADPSMLVVVGGDGTIRAVAESIQQKPLPLAIVPAGTGNLLARNLGLPRDDLAQAIRIAFTGRDRPIDLGLAEFDRDDGTADHHVFVVMAGIGLDANMAANTNSLLKRRLGWMAYTDPIARSVLANKRTTMHYRLDQDDIRVIEAHTLIVGNCGTLTANILLLPDAEPDDGMLDVVMLSPKGFGGWARIGSRLAFGRMIRRTAGGRLVLRLGPQLRALRYAQFRDLRVDLEAAHEIELDGDGFGPVSGVTISVRPHGLIVRVPDTATTHD